VIRRFLVSALILMAAGSCAPALKDLKPSLGATDSGTIWFASAGSLPRSPDGSRFVPGDPVVLSGDLGFPSGCLQKGATIAGNSEAAALSRQNVRAQLLELMK